MRYKSVLTAFWTDRVTVFALTAAVMLFPFSIPSATAQPVTKAAPDIGARRHLPNALPNDKAPNPSAAQQSALNGLRGSAPGLVVRWSALTGAPSRLHQPRRHTHRGKPGARQGNRRGLFKASSGVVETQHTRPE